MGSIFWSLVDFTSRPPPEHATKLIRKGVIPEKWQAKYTALVGTRNDLERLSLTQAWSLRETDLYDYQRQLDRFDEQRVDGNWLDEDGQPAELYVQRVSKAEPGRWAQV